MHKTPAQMGTGMAQLHKTFNQSYDPAKVAQAMYAAGSKMCEEFIEAYNKEFKDE